MCRHLGYLGPAVPIARLVHEPPHSLVHQSYAPADMRGGGTINADGYGVGWYPAPGGPAVRYRRAGAIWADENLAALSRVTASGAVLAAVRSATVGMPVVDTACAPFTDGRWLFSHNGRVVDWPSSVVDLAASLPVESLLTLDAPTDSALLWALVRSRLNAGSAPADAVAGVVAEVAAAAPGSRLNLLLTNGSVLVGTTWTHSLWVRRDDGAVTLSSEPLDDGPWAEVPDGRVVVADPSTVDVQPIGRR
ncbi:ergothioneine biosynthesis protein EgtC [Saccharothrix coeruleofusca]|uniref:Gamma-glutamyl-hercynylcysteine sulfoxide hydrolase n=1 Tax=Saccharothrix coeruleofusca TaxID=33919 RepID=A0A918APG3_9PSEU|nr:ergothioneine biosynthesis protein EgtC [Saccharothrix coeruleofusca]MBP2337085.1 glutamine amidotransferase [Saccharothrix coeruleofusca]GGP67260.1 gamma-glutamyl-hercynylcysteine sulfoxide hydrolase [Saccharothrix coeruleofusca]